MAQVVVTLRIMPLSPDTDLSLIESQAKQEIKRFTGHDDVKMERKPIAFGLKAVEVMFLTPEEKGSTEELEKSIAKIEGVNSAEVTDVRRAVG